MITSIVFSMCFVQIVQMLNVTELRMNNWIWTLERLDRYAINFKDYEIDFQIAYDKNKEKKALNKLYPVIKNRVFERSTIKALFALYDEYDPVIGNPEKETPEKEKKIEEFLRLVLDSHIVRLMLNLLRLAKVPIVMDDAEFRAWFKKIWFTPYARRNEDGIKDSSLFEHLFLGEVAEGKVVGFHSWLRYAYLERKGEIEYLGYRIKQVGVYSEIQFKWNGNLKTCSSMLLKTTPEFDMAFFTMVFLLKREKVQFRGCLLKMAWYDLENTEGEQMLSTVFAKPGNKCKTPNYKAGM